MNPKSEYDNTVRLPVEPIDPIVRAFDRFIHIQAASGIVLLIATIAALLLANSTASESFAAFWKLPIGITIGDHVLKHSLKHWINDGLMVLFFFLVGLEVKREIVHGELRQLRTAVLPLFAAAGGMIVPATFYLMFQWQGPAQSGWGIPMATDIAFVIGCLAILGPRVPRSLRVFLLTLAIADDIGAILVIAIGYTTELRLNALAWGIAGIVAVLGCARLGIRSIPVYVLLGIAIWFSFHESGVHATIAGVILGLLTPASPWVNRGTLAQIVNGFSNVLSGDGWNDNNYRKSILITAETAARESISPVERLEFALHPWVAFLIMPLFAFANAGVQINLETLTDSVSVAVFVGLAVGKPVGIFAFSWIAVVCGVAKLPAGMSWRILIASGLLAGIGFTMSLFIAGLALKGPSLESAKIGTLAASFVCAVLGMLALHYLLPSTTSDHSSV